jgi:Carboxypeptidase regulatory-like domain
VLAGLLVLTALLGAGPPAHPPSRVAPPRPTGTLVGSLRHKGCPTAPPGATVSVIGRDATATADAEGRFSLTLPPGTYSLVIGGPGLVADQRVDDVVISLGQTRDLGTVEVWPEERSGGCVSGPPPPAVPALIAIAPDTPALDLPGAGVAPTGVTPEQIWVRGGPGSGQGQFGLMGNPARDDEDALGPPSFAIGPMGSLWVLDALNGRVQRFDPRGRPTASFSLGRHNEEPVVEADVAVSEDGHVFLFAENDPPTLSEHDSNGRLLVGGALPPSFRGVDLLFAIRQRPVFLMQNGQAVRAEMGWGGLRAEGPLPGVPAGDLYVHAERVDRWRAALKLSAVDGRVRRSVQLHSRVPIAGVRLVGVDRRGEIVLAVDRTEGGRGDFADEGAGLRSEVLLLAIDQHGHLAGAASVPPGGRRFEFREFALAPDGTVVQMQSDASEVRFVRWTLRAPPRDALAGEGLVRGRLVDGGRSCAGATVSVVRLRRSVPVAPDGSFEVRLPAGTWLVALRRAAGDGGVEPAVEVKVAVAAGATVDVGTVSLALPRPVRAQTGAPDAGVPGAALGP